MTTNKPNEFMGNVKWRTAFWGGSVLLALAGMYYGLKGDIKDSRTDNKEQMLRLSANLNHKIDSSNSANALQFQSIKDDLRSMSTTSSSFGQFTQRWLTIGGKRTLVYIPVK